MSFHNLRLALLLRQEGTASSSSINFKLQFQAFKSCLNLCQQHWSVSASYGVCPLDQGQNSSANTQALADREERGDLVLLLIISTICIRQHWLMSSMASNSNTLMLTVIHSNAQIIHL